MTALTIGDDTKQWVTANLGTNMLEVIFKYLIEGGGLLVVGSPDFVKPRPSSETTSAV